MRITEEKVLKSENIIFAPKILLLPD